MILKKEKILYFLALDSIILENKNKNNEHILILEIDKKDKNIINKFKNLFYKHFTTHFNLFIYETKNGYHFLSFNKYTYEDILDFGILCIKNKLISKKHFSYGLTYNNWSIRISKKYKFLDYKFIYWNLGEYKIMFPHFFIYNQIPEINKKIKEIPEYLLFKKYNLQVRGYYCHADRYK